MFNEIADKLCILSKCNGDGLITLNEGEEKYSIYGPMKKAAVLNEDVIKGEILNLDKIQFQRTKETTDLSQLERIIASIIYEKPPKGSYQEAIKFFSRAIEIKPNEIRNHFWLGKTYYATENPLLAKKEFEIVISLNPRDIDDKQTQANARTLLKKSF